MLSPRAFGLAGWSGAGKTTLLEALIAEYARRGIVVNAIKHSHHDIPLEPPHKDSARLRAAGAGEVAVVSPYRYAIVHELRAESEPSLAEILARLAPAELTLVESYKHAKCPKLEVWRAAVGQPMLWPDDGSIVAIASDDAVATTLPRFGLTEIAALADFILLHAAPC
ncbi:molybdopterin-guanine dinucleotide biosynthesis protein B [Chitinolyticbacter meiyuanensis]|uniref:molybdopterin-guanine dinucleotide biosynthesis protein B n=1 Tax=Chitinolyticbacter meiyuanensis TaxID=682798 RepID=UPI0011E5C3E0|nr:molybdopterin-guanine dinucleotide biosynthesis protein B [Chitinolyticbacter meiyuanensis]